MGGGGGVGEDAAGGAIRLRCSRCCAWTGIRFKIPLMKHTCTDLSVGEYVHTSTQ